MTSLDNMPTLEDFNSRMLATINASSPEIIPSKLINPTKQYLDQLALEAVPEDKRRTPLEYVCDRCNVTYLYPQYYAYLLSEGIDKNTVGNILMYEVGDCCEQDLANYPQDSILFTESEINVEELLVHYIMTIGDDPDEYKNFLDMKYVDTFKPPSIDGITANKLQLWVDNPTDDIPSVNITSNDRKHLDISRDCHYPLKCTSCGTPPIYAYLYLLLIKFGLNKEELLLQFQTHRYCCKNTYMCPIMKPIEYTNAEEVVNLRKIFATKTTLPTRTLPTTRTIPVARKVPPKMAVKAPIKRAVKRAVRQPR